MIPARVTARLLLLAALPTLAGHGWWCAEGEVVSVTGPEFLPTDELVVAAVGQDVQLECRVRNLGDKAVSWVRSRDLQILSHAGAVFTADARVTVRVAGAGASAGATKHSLRIRRLRASDAGRYECQLNTDPKMSLFFNLTVVDEPVPVVVVSAAAREVRGAAGGAAALQCVARYEPPPRALPVPPLDIAWTKDGQPVDLQRLRGGVSRDTERWPARAESRLTLSELTAADAGLYRCAAAGVVGAEPPAADYLQLYVDAESQMEAMQRDQSLDSSARRPAAAALLVTLATLVTIETLVTLLH